MREPHPLFAAQTGRRTFLSYIAAGTGPKSQKPTGVKSATQAKPVDQGAVALHVDLGPVLEQPAPPANQQQQSAPGVVVVLMQLQVLGQVGDPLAQQRDLGFWPAGVGVMQAVLAQNGFLLFGSERHEINSISIGPRT